MYEYLRNKNCIIDENLLLLKDHVKSSERNISIIKEYINDKTLKELGEVYHLSKEGIRRIISDYVVHCHWYIGRLNPKFTHGRVTNFSVDDLNSAQIIGFDCDFLGFKIDKLNGTIVQTKNHGNSIYKDCTKGCEAVMKEQESEENKIGTYFADILHGKANEACVDHLKEYKVWLY